MKVEVLLQKRLNEKVNNLDIFSAESLLKCNLVDETLTENEFETRLCTLFGVEKAKNLVLTDLNNYIKANNKTNIKIKDKIAVLYANGEITMDTKNTASAKELQKEIRAIKEDKSIKAVVLRVNSPGGDAQAAEIINNELQSLRQVKPVVVSMGEYAASGGYWIAANSEKIFADNNTITGSIGVFSLIPSYGKGLKEYLKINNISIKSNDHSDMLLGIRDLDNKEIYFMQQMVDTVYTQFIDLVSKGRNLSTQYVDSIGQGRVWTGSDALNVKLIDEIGGLSDAINYAASITNCNEFRLAEYPKPKTSFEQLVEMFSTTNAKIKALNNPIDLINAIYKNTITKEKGKTYARSPYIYNFTY
jgi:signal peptide peptidase SppA, 36K type